MIETDKEIENKINSLNYQLQQIENNIKIKKILTSNVANIILFFILILHTCIFAKGLYYYISYTYIFALFILLEFLLKIAIFAILEKKLEEDLKVLEEKSNNLKESKEKILDFSCYLVACRHIDSIKKGNSIDPNLIYSDSEYLYNKYKSIYEEKRIRYENGDKIQVLYEIQIETEKEQE